MNTRRKEELVQHRIKRIIQKTENKRGMGRTRRNLHCYIAQLMRIKRSRTV